MLKKRLGVFALSVVTAMSVLTGCSTSSADNEKNKAESENSIADSNTSVDENIDKLSIVCTIFPEYDWTKEILGSQFENADVKYLLDKGADLHNFQPTAQDMVTISECDLFIYVGGESDEWVEDALSTAKNKDMQVINLMEVMGDKAVEEEMKEGMMPEDEEEEGEDDEEEEVEYDEHFWTSLRNAKIICGEICDSLCTLDSKNADAYKKNLASYSEKLDKMDGDFKALIDSASEKTLVFGDRFPFRYFVDDYGLDYYAAFVGCSAETEASFETITFLANKIDELNCDTIFVIENSDHSIAEGIISNTQNKNQNIAELNSMQSVTADMVKNGTTYLGLMQKNYDVLKEALS